MYCNECGSELKDGAAFCTQCGHPVEKAAAFCTECGTQLAEGMRFCTHCGTPVGGGEADGSASDLTESEAAASDVEEMTADRAVDRVVDPSVDERDRTEPSAIAAHAVEPDVAAISQASDAANTVEETEVVEVVREEPPAVHAEQENEAGDVDSTQKLDAVSRVRAASAPVKRGTHSRHSSATNEKELKKKPKTERTDTASNKKPVIIAVVALVVVIAAVLGILLATGFFRQAVPIDEKTFPNGTIRAAVLAQLDENGDGELSAEDADQVAGLVYTGSDARFVRKGEKMDVDVVYESLDQGASDRAAGTADASLSGLNVFQNLEVISAHDADLEKVDLAGMSHLTYLDVRGNDISEVNVSGCPDLTLFCETDVNIKGLSDAGLYYTDLVTSITTPNGWSNRVDYDTRGRIVKVSDFYGDRSEPTRQKTYEYDEKGRLCRSEDDGAYVTQTYSYNDADELSAYEYHWLVDGIDVSRTCSYGYAEDGRLTELATAGVEQSEYRVLAGSFAYDDGHVSAFRAADNYQEDVYVADTFVFDDQGRISSMLTNEDRFALPSETPSTIDISTYEYDGNGALVSHTFANELLNQGQHTPYSTTVDRSADGALKGASLMDYDHQAVELSFECNSDGYVDTVHWLTNGAGVFRAGDVTSIAYVKMVAPLEERKDRIYVPEIRLSAPLGEFTDRYFSSSWNDLYASTATGSPVSFIEWGPETAAFRAMGVTSEALMTMNDLTLARYDREHWGDAFNTSAGAQLIEDQRIKNLISDSSEIETPIPLDSLADDPHYGDIVKQYREYGKLMNSGTHGDWYEMIESYPAIPYAVGPLLEGELFCTLVDVDGDGTQELAVSSELLLNENAYSCCAIYAYIDGEATQLVYASDHERIYVCDEDRYVRMTRDDSYAGSYAGYEFENGEFKRQFLLQWDGHPYAGSDRYDVTLEKNGATRSAVVDEAGLAGFRTEASSSYTLELLSWTCVTSI